MLEVKPEAMLEIMLEAMLEHCSCNAPTMPIPDPDQFAGASNLTYRQPL
ncbi:MULTISPECIES: hypothetical protein [Nocardioides]|uniref:Uncharacterized protein n=1 Tax=Nocardioides vastitatis TaxID=2568655 RepID=A0ABW0ZQT5_9ACTN|nr:hypothetical protein [Nocardioides sp.]